MSNDSKEFRELANISLTLRNEYIKENNRWIGSPFEWIKHRPSRSIGAIGETMVSMWLTQYKFNVSRSPDSEADRIIEGKRVEIKLSTLWEGNFYKFQQIRDQNYSFAIMLGLSPEDAHCWVFTKENIIELINSGVITGQHTGKSATDTKWLQIDRKNYNFFKQYGGNLNKALNIIATLTDFYPKSLSEEFDN